MPRDLDAPVDETPEDDDRVVVAVVRSGGIAGIRRRWQVEPPRPETRVWIGLIERCPWDAPRETDAGADRYVWSIRVRMPQEQRERELADSELQGAWRELVDAVREADSAKPAPEPVEGSGAADAPATPDDPTSRG
ncbi:protealysin inhibitor emfourin [Microbacterium aerolatum]|uniref:Uncharacterized protein n=1 Tax=Microbacterium aerolatum TaxID=153731 RepID=A0A511AJ75_9MICO|nr:protealysin inhibitor emfourin [Microbacterium aerolatum]GEK87383.1 hypothetical protein MAE01_25590 [Microbacterium aerolatum]GGB33109.1 hypothetical protein GCM10007198_24550 [Microbacterium aerolatum]